LASKRHLRRRSCEDKVRFESLASASAALRRAYRREYRAPMTTYRCKFCGGWHYGRIPGRYRR
jgi:hypothetical protein